jgi:hypothetical protein
MIEDPIWVACWNESGLCPQLPTTIASEDAQAAAVRSNGQKRGRCDGQAPLAGRSGDEGSQRRGVPRPGARTTGLPTLSATRLRGGTESNPSTVETWPRSSLEKGERDRDPVQRNTDSGWVSRSARSPVRRPATLSPLMQFGSVRGASGLPAEGWRQRFSAVVIAWRITARGDASLDSSRPAQ